MWRLCRNRSDRLSVPQLRLQHLCQTLICLNGRSRRHPRLLPPLVVQLLAGCQTAATITLTSSTVTEIVMACQAAPPVVVVVLLLVAAWRLQTPH
jgi:hypothetical protein